LDATGTTYDKTSTEMVGGVSSKASLVGSGVSAGYNKVMSFAKSKLISSTPDYFICSANNSANRLREPVTAVAANMGNYGHILI